MPPGAKKKRAARKKKNSETHTIMLSTNNTLAMLGNDNSKSQDGKESDNGEVNSPVSRVQDNDQNPFNEGSEDLGERYPSSIQSFVAEDKSMEGFPSNVEGAQKVGLVDDGIIEIERELKSEGNFESKNGIVEHVELAKEPPDSNDQSSSSSSSDDEARVTDGTPKEAYNSVLEVSSYDDFVKPVENPVIADVVEFPDPVVSVSQETVYIIESASVESQVGAAMVESGPKENPNVKSSNLAVSVSQETLHLAESAPAEKTVVADVVEWGTKENPLVKSPNPALFVSLETVLMTESAPVENPVVADVVESGPKENALVESPNPAVSVSQETIHLTESAPVEKTVVADVAESGTKENLLVESPNPAVCVSLETIRMTESAPVENPVVADMVESGPKENPLVKSPNPAVSVSQETILLTESALVENPVVADVVESGPEENPLVESPNPAVSVPLVTNHMTESALVVNTVLADVVESGSKEIDEKLLHKSSHAPAAVMDLTVNNNVNNVFPSSDDNVQASLTVVESVSNGYEGKVSPSSSVFVAATSNGAAHAKDSEIPEYSESQPPVAPAPHLVKQTSWLSCCGLFEVLTGTGR